MVKNQIAYQTKQSHYSIHQQAYHDILYSQELQEQHKPQFHMADLKVGHLYILYLGQNQLILGLSFCLKVNYQFLYHDE